MGGGSETRQYGLGLEVLGLGVQDVDFRRRAVRIEWQLAPSTQVRARMHDAAARRTVPLRQVVADAVAAHIATFPSSPDGKILMSSVGAIYWQDSYASRVSTAR